MSYYRNNVYKNEQYKYRKNSDILLEKEISRINLDSIEKKAVDFALNHQLLNTELWETFVEQFRLKSDSKSQTWKGEFFGKMMRGGVFIYKINNDKKLYNILKKSCLDLISTIDEDGRISTYSKEDEFNGWDIWCRKYVMLGLLYFLEICSEDDTKTKITKALISHADYIVNHIGSGDEKKEILDTSYIWGCVNSCTILEPMVKLYNLTGYDRYLDFSKYIISTGGCNLGNLVELAYENVKYPYEYPTTKAYEMMSFFEGISEFYSITGDEKLKTAFLNFVDKMIETDYTIIGCAGCTHELFDHSSLVQTEPQPDIVQETCVTVTMMKVFTRALELTNDSKYADLIEKSYYNAMIGAINYNMNDKLYWGKEYEYQFDYSPSNSFMKRIKGLTFDSYSPLLKDARSKKTGGYQLMDGNKAYGCCACIGSLGVATLPLYSIMQNDNGITINFYHSFSTNFYTPNGNKGTIKVDSNYPYLKTAKISILLDNEEEFSIALRIPAYVDKACIDNKAVPTGNYYVINKTWHNNEINISFEWDLKVNLLNNKVAVTDGLITYAIDNRIDNIDTLASEKIVSYKEIEKDFTCNREYLVEFDNGNKVKMVDYSSAGAIYDEGKNKVTVWMETR